MTMETISAFSLSYGRIARSTWLFRILALGLTCTAFGMLAEAIAGNAGAALIAALFLWCAGAVSIQRLHDTGRPGWILFALLIPVLGPVWVLMLILRRGVDGRNHYGEDPMARMDYLKVDTTK